MPRSSKDTFKTRVAKRLRNRLPRGYQIRSGAPKLYAELVYYIISDLIKSADDHLTSKNLKTLSIRALALALADDSDIYKAIGEIPIGRVTPVFIQKAFIPKRLQKRETAQP